MQGGGKLALLFGRQLPQGPYWLSFISQQRPEYVHQIEALQENAMALTAIIPSECGSCDPFNDIMGLIYSYHVTFVTIKMITCDLMCCILVG